MLRRIFDYLCRYPSDQQDAKRIPIIHWVQCQPIQSDRIDFPLESRSTCPELICQEKF